MQSIRRIGLFAIVIAAAAVFLSGCSEEEEPVPVSVASPPVQPVVQTPATPPRPPRPSLDTFITMVKKNDPKYARYYIGYKVYQADGKPPMMYWASHLKWNETGFWGKIQNPPANSGAAHGNNVYTRREQISDWMMVTKDKRMVGGETLRAERAALQPHLREAFDKKWDIKFD